MSKAGKRKDERPRRTTFARQVECVTRRADAALWRTATTASQMAKCCQGRNRVILYRRKHQAIKQLIELGRVVVGVDHERHAGLLSVRAVDDHRFRLHTHENWLGVGWRTGA